MWSNSEIVYILIESSGAKSRISLIHKEFSAKHDFKTSNIIAKISSQKRACIKARKCCTLPKQFIEKN